MKALFWDFDGTLVDSRLKNYRVTKNIINDTTDLDQNANPLLQNFENYKKDIIKYSNWRDIYQNGFKLSAEDTDRIGRLWTEYQLKDTTATPLFEGIREVLLAYRDHTNVIISQNSKHNIDKVLNRYDISSIFNLIMGFEEIDIRKQKPDPSGFLKCIYNLSLQNGYQIFYIGDHETDITFARNALTVLESIKSSSSIQTIGVFYGNDQSVSDWKIKPDFVADTPGELVEIINTA